MSAWRDFRQETAAEGASNGNREGVARESSRRGARRPATAFREPFESQPRLSAPASGESAPLHRREGRDLPSAPGCAARRDPGEDRHALAVSVPAIQQLIDPKKRTNDDRTGWAYEGFLLEALDRRGIPFVAVYNWWRGPHAGGGQWAVDPSLYPYPHG
jgi:hypothetical protein